MGDSKKATPAPVTAKQEVRAKRDEVRARVRGKRGAVRRAAGLVAVMLGLSFLFGCATATPSSKSQVSKACNNTVSVTIALVVPTNAVGAVEIQPGGVSITLSDLIGTQVQSADAGRDDTVGQSAAPANTSGLNGDKAIEGVADTVQAGLTGGGLRFCRKAKPR